MPRPPRRVTAVRTLRSAPESMTEQRTTTTTTVTHEDIIQPLRQREESVNYRIGYRALTSLGLAGSEGDDKPISYQQIYGPTPLRVYRRPAPLPPRRFRHLAETADDRSVQPSPPPDAKPSPAPAPALDAAPVGPQTPANSPTEVPAPGDLPEAGILPDPAQEAARSRDEEILSYFRRPRMARTTPTTPLPGGNGYGAEQNGIDPAYLQAPEQLPIPPSRATYRVVPK